ncbi:MULTISPECIES: type II toxin-antitoxin system VapC family toxin [unclassified Achromobacter]|uniref:type II toxin-antitoxin system VapC family toxin n=1 Tax=unclassified Achromobacter TaxID=2626865 RepID=UPI000B51BFC0|nr:MULTISPECIES: type II toxin-antitoxin system VapC family toxin [unclassified Achromobacter]OWT80540.1 VapC toxin family PIN domain ribonuclease [Achromobacter sp. HZ34]OWT82423.1 VapC toxin family PIN domain ribonuclease [Achromobacter sp. HZ28]
MIVLDTNILSEILRPAPDDHVLAWLAGQVRSSLFTTTITEAELLYGVQLLPDGDRKSALEMAVSQVFVIDLAGHVLAFDSDAAAAYAEISATRKLLGRPISQFDASIAGVARSRGASVATRNVKDFRDCGVDVINPWEHRLG